MDVTIHSIELFNSYVIIQLSPFEILILLLSFVTSFIKFKTGWQKLHQFKVVWFAVQKSLNYASIKQVYVIWIFLFVMRLLFLFWFIDFQLFPFYLCTLDFWILGCIGTRYSCITNVGFLIWLFLAQMDPADSNTRVLFIVWVFVRIDCICKLHFLVSCDACLYNCDDLFQLSLHFHV